MGNLQRDGVHGGDFVARAELVLPGGVNSPVRAFRAVGGNPVIASHGRGAHLFDHTGKQYIDYIQSWGALILGHCSDIVSTAVERAMSRGSGFGLPTREEVEFAELVIDCVPSLEMVRFVSSGTEATMSALRVARAYTGRDVVLKCNGCYHGHADSFLVEAGSGVATFGIAGSAGVPDALAALTVSVPFNDLERMEKVVNAIGGEKIAALIVEPIAANMGLVLPKPGYLAGLRVLCDKFGIVLIFDEVITGFRVALGGAQELYGVTPDLTTLGKIIGGGLPIGAFGGKRELMQMVAPLGPVYQAGTLSGNPLSVSAGMAVVQYLKENNPYAELNHRASMWEEGMTSAAKKTNVELQVSRVGSLLGFFFSDRQVSSYEDAKGCDTKRFTQFFQGMLSAGVLFAPSAFEAGFIGLAHTEELIQKTLGSVEQVFVTLSGKF